MAATPHTASSSMSELGELPAFKSWYMRHAAALGYGLAALAILVGWLGREERHIRADIGLGYWLGIIGASMMALLLLYPARKRMRFLQRAATISLWFRAHIALGVLGPLLILYHCNFQLGSLNSRVALFSTLLVALSGLVGRYLYANVFVGLSGRKAELQQLVDRARLTADQKKYAAAFVPNLLERMSEYDRKVLQPPDNMLANALLPVSLALRTREARFTLTRFARRQIQLQALKSSRSATERAQLEAVVTKFIAEHLKRVRRVAAFGFYERVFSLWHFFHLPFFYILVSASLIHVLAVHMY